MRHRFLDLIEHPAAVRVLFPLAGFPKTLVRELRIEGRIVDRSEVTFDADLGVERAALGDALRFDLPRLVAGK
jgi:hypothetical protein